MCCIYEIKANAWHFVKHNFGVQGQTVINETDVACLQEIM